MAFIQEAKFELDKFLGPSAKPEVTKMIRRSFQNKKNKMIAEFLNHPVTVEIKGGINAENISGTLGGGKGNLFSFIGFESEQDPIEPIIDLLQRSVQIKFVRSGARFLLYTVEIPEPKEIFQITPMPWAAGRSWAKGIESGISGLGYYLRKKTATSRSGLGIQSPRKVRKKGSQFKNTKYISDFINKYKKEFQNLSL
jgi:hypothetical protein